MQDLVPPPIRLLVADDDALARSLLASCAREIAGEIAVLEAEDGAEAVQLGLQERPEIALLDVNMPRLGGIEAALTLRELQPRIRLALQTADPLTHRERAWEERLTIFGKLDLDETLAWLHAQVQSVALAEPGPKVSRKQSLRCGACGYGIMRATPPDQCPMCKAQDAWILVAPRSSTPVLTR